MEIERYGIGNLKYLNKYEPGEVLGCSKPLGPQLAAYEARVLLRRLEGNPDTQGEAFLAGDHYQRAREIVNREKQFIH